MKLTKSLLFQLIKEELNTLYEWPESKLYKGRRFLDEDELEEQEFLDEDERGLQEFLGLDEEDGWKP